jgi:hypothetical protein
LVAHYYFDQGSYPQALQWFQKWMKASATDRDKFNFQKDMHF